MKSLSKNFILVLFVSLLVSALNTQQIALSEDSLLLGNSWQSMQSERPKNTPFTSIRADEWSDYGYEQSIVNTDQNLGLLNKIIYADNPLDGFTRNGMFLHPKMKYHFNYPDKRLVINHRALVATVNIDQYRLLIILPDNDQAGLETGNTGQNEDRNRLKFYICSSLSSGMIYQLLNNITFENYGSYRFQFKEVPQGFGQHTINSGIQILQPKLLHSVKTSTSNAFHSFHHSNLENLTKTIAPEYLAIMNKAELDRRIENSMWNKIRR
jgi:hypothetical protein